MGLLGKLIGSEEYNFGGKYHVRITDEAFEKATEIVKNYTSEEREAHSDYLKKVNEDIFKYDAHDFPVIEITSIFKEAWDIQEEIDNVPVELRYTSIMANYNWGRKDDVEFKKLSDQYFDKLDSKEMKRNKPIEKDWIGGIQLLGKGLSAVTTLAKGNHLGKFGEFERYTKYIYGDSIKAKEYLLHFANELGTEDEGVMTVVGETLNDYMMREFVKWRTEVSKG